MIGSKDYCADCKAYIGNGFTHLESFPAHYVYTDKMSADKATQAKEQKKLDLK